MKMLKRINVPNLLKAKAPYDELILFMERFGCVDGNNSVQYSDLQRFCENNGKECWLDWIEDNGFVQTVKSKVYLGSFEEKQPDGSVKVTVGLISDNIHHPNGWDGDGASLLTIYIKDSRLRIVVLNNVNETAGRMAQIELSGDGRAKTSLLNFVKC